MTTLTIQAGWGKWKERFLDSFADKGWSTGIYAITYRYKEGSLMEYELKKERLLVDMDKNIGARTLVMLMVAGSPEFVRNHIDQEKCQDSIGVLHELRKCGYLVNKNSFMKKKEESHNIKKTYEQKKPCKRCEPLNKGVRYHPEDMCWFNESDRKEVAETGAYSVEVDLCPEQKN